MRVKICGLRSRAEAAAAAAAGAAYVGLVFFPRSPRHVTLGDARWVAEGVPEGLIRVALTVDAEDDELEALVASVPVDMLQLHGHESPDRVAQLRARFGLPVMKAVGIEVEKDVAALDAYADVADQILVDARAPHDAARPGGQRGAVRLAAAARAALDATLDAGRRAYSRQRRRGGAPDRRGPGGCLVRRRARAGRQGPRACPGLRPRRQGGGAARSLSPAPPADRHLRPGRVCRAAFMEAWMNRETRNSLPHRPRRARPLRRLRRALRVRDADAADPGARGALRGGQDRPGLLGRDGRTSGSTTSAAPSPLYFAERLTERLGGAKVYFKRDELNHTGAHKINNVLGQILLARRMGKTRIIAETGAGQHGVATATVCARFGLDCVVFMGATDVERQKPNVFRMKLLGAEVVPVTSGRGTLKDAMNEALRDWVTNVRDTFYCIGTVAGPHPYPAMVRDFQAIIGRETRAQMQEAEGRLPDTLVACIGGGSNAMGLFHPFLDDPEVRIIGVEAGGHGVDERMEHAASLTGGRPGRAARQPHLPAAGRGRADHRGALDLGRARLSGHRPRARLAARHRPGRVRQRDRRRGAGGVPARLRD